MVSAPVFVSTEEATLQSSTAFAKFLSTALQFRKAEIYTYIYTYTSLHKLENMNCKTKICLKSLHILRHMCGILVLIKLAFPTSVFNILESNIISLSISAVAFDGRFKLDQLSIVRVDTNLALDIGLILK